MATSTNILYYIPSKHEFLKIQAGTGDNLDADARKEGYIDYVLCSTFKPEDLGIDDELTMESTNSSMVYLKDDVDTEATLPLVLEEMYGKKRIKAIKLMTDDDLEEDEDEDED